jgi:malate dehydrogenase (oxaloacetate-decarboxylating)
VQRRLAEALDIPVFHDDQQGTAIVALAALHNALRVMGRSLDELSIVVSGAGAAGSAVTRLLLSAGAHQVRVCDSKGVLHPGRDDVTGEKRWLAEHTGAPAEDTGLGTALIGADVFIGVSAPGILDEKDVARMAEGAVVFALANPDPEIAPERARRHASVVATGSSDDPNQINNALVFPGMLRGLLDAGATTLTADMQLRAARAIADRVPADRVDPQHIVPDVFDEGLVPAVSAAVAGPDGR